LAKRTAGTGWGRHVKVVTVVDDGTSEVGTNEWNEDLDNKGILGFSPANATITIAGDGTLTPTDSIVVCAANSSTSDTITKLTNTNTNEYDFLYLFADTGDTITLTHTSGTPSNAGEVVLLGEANKTLDEKVPTIIVRKGNYWYEYGGSPVIAGTGLSKSAATLSIDMTDTNAIKDEDNMSSDSATHLATQQSIKAYVDSQVTAQDLDTAGDSGTGAIDLDSQSLTISGGSGITTTASNQAITIDGDNATTSAKGVASFSSDNFSVTSGAVTIKDSGVSNDELAGSISNDKLAGSISNDKLAGSISNDKLAGSIANSKLVNSSITVSDGSNSTATALGGTVTFSGTSNEVEVAESSGTVTVGLPNDVTITGDLTVNGTTTTINSTTLEVADKQIEIAKVSSPSNSTANGGGILIEGGSDGDKTITWTSATGDFDISENIDIASGKVFKINGTEILGGTTLGSTIVSSSLTSVGTIATGTWEATDVAVAHGGTGSSTAGGARTNLGLVIGTDVQAYDAQLDSIAALTANQVAGLVDLATLEAPASDGQFIVATGAGAFAYESGATVRTSLGLTIGTHVQAYDAQLDTLAALTANQVGGLVDLATLDAPASEGQFIVATGSGAFAYESGSTVRTSLGLAIGTDVQAYDAQLADVSGLTAGDGNFIVGDGSNFVAESGSTARSSLGLGTIATQAANSVNIDGGAIDGTTIGANSAGAVTATQVDITAEGDLRLQDASGGEYVGFEAPSAVTTSYTLEMPVETGSAGEVLKLSSSANVLEWGSAGGGATSTHDYTLQAYDYSGGGASGTTRSVYIRPLKTSGGAEDTNNEGVFVKIKKNGTADTEVQIA